MGLFQDMFLMFPYWVHVLLLYHGSDTQRMENIMFVFFQTASREQSSGQFHLPGIDTLFQKDFFLRPMDVNIANIR